MSWARLTILLTWLPLAFGAAAQPLELLVYPNPGLFDVSARGEISGRGATMLNRLAQVTGLELQLKPVPPVRALQMILQQPGQCAAGVPRTPEREALFRWAGLMASGALTLYGRAEEKREVKSAVDLRGTVTVAQRESQPLAWLREHGHNAYEVNDTVTGLRMLHAGRVDYWLVNDLPARHAIQRSDEPPPKVLREFGRINLYLACHRDINPAAAERLRRGLDDMRRAGDLVDLGLR